MECFIRDNDIKLVDNVCQVFYITTDLLLTYSINFRERNFETSNCNFLFVHFKKSSRSETSLLTSHVIVNELVKLMGLSFFMVKMLIFSLLTSEGCCIHRNG